MTEAPGNEHQTMRIWHQSLTVLGEQPDYQATLERHMRRIVRPGTEVVLHGLLPQTYSSDYPLAELQYPALAYYHFNQLLSAAIVAEEQGFDAYAMCFLGGPLLDEMRSAVDIPVVNYGEAACHFAALYGQRFGVIRFAEHMVESTRDYIAKWGFEKECVGIAGCGLGYQQVFGGLAKPEKAIAQFQERAREFIQATGAEVIIPGEMPLCVLLAAHGVSRVDDVPIIDGLAVTLMMAEMMVDLRQRFGLYHSRHGRLNRSPPRERLLHVARAYGMDRTLSGDKGS